MLSEVVALASGTAAGAAARRPGPQRFDAIVTTILRLRSSEVTSANPRRCRRTNRRGCSATPGSAPPSRTGSTFVSSCITAADAADTYHLGAHPPSLAPGDLDLIHRVWL